MGAHEIHILLNERKLSNGLEDQEKAGTTQWPSK